MADVATFRYHLRSTAEFNTCAPPLAVLDVLEDFLYLIFKRDYPDWVGVSLPEDSTHSRDVMSGLQVNLFTENLNVPFDPVPTEVLDPFDIRIRNTRLVGKVETQFSGCNERSSLVDVVSKDFSEGPVENVGSSVVVSERPSTQLRSRVSNQPLGGVC